MAAARKSACLVCAAWAAHLVAGGATGAAAFGVLRLVEALQAWRHDVLRSGLALGLAPAAARLAVVSVAYVAGAALLVVLVAPAAAASGIPDVKAILNGAKVGTAPLALATGAVKCVGLSLAVAGGLAVGREGPLVHTGAVLTAAASTVAENALERLDVRGEWDSLRDFVAGGAAAGVSAAFGAPLGGVLFAVEEAMSVFLLTTMWRSFSNAFASGLVLTLCFAAANRTSLSINQQGGLLTFGLYGAGTSYSLAELPVFAVMGCVGGLGGALFVRLNTALTLARRRLLTTPTLRVLDACSVALLTSVVAFAVCALNASRCMPVPPESPEVHASYFTRFQCESGHYNPFATILLSNSEGTIHVLLHAGLPLDIGALVVSAFAYFALSVMTYGTAVPSGLFVPLILVGASSGRLLGELANVLSEAAASRGLYALIGAAAALGGVTRMTVSLAVIIAETTGSITLVLPLMLSLLCSKGVGDAFTDGIYDVHVGLSAVGFVRERPPAALDGVDVSAVMSKPVVSLPLANCTVGELLACLDPVSHDAFPVVNGKGQLEGLVSREALVRLLNASATVQSSGLRWSPSAGRSKISQRLRRIHRGDEESASALDAPLLPLQNHDTVDVSLVMERAPLVAQETWPASCAYRLFRSQALQHLPVVDRSNVLVGFVTRRDVTR